MDHYEEVTETIIHKKFIKTTCDICGKDIQEENMGSYFNEVTIFHEYGQRWQGCQTAKKFEPDVCIKCFTEKILPFLKSLGIDIKYVDSSY